MPMYERPPFWRVPRQKYDPNSRVVKQQVRQPQVTPGTPASKELVRGDIIGKIDDYDGRDLRHEDAQNLFKNAANQIKIVVQRGGSGSHLYSLPRSPGSFVGRVPTPTFYHEYAEDADREGRGTPLAPRSPLPYSVASSYRTPSPGQSLPWSPQNHGPESLPRTPLPPYTPTPSISVYTDDYRPLSVATNEDMLDESINSQPYRTTPLVLPGAKVRREPGPTESYLRHHPNPAMRAPPSHDYRDTLMRQKVAESVIQRVVGEEGNKVAHKQFNSPINMYSDQNIANSIRQQTSPLPSYGHYGRPNVVKSHKPTVLYDPAKSETFRALQEEGLGDIVQEVPTPIQTKVFTAPPNKRPIPTPKPSKQHDETSKGKQTTFVSSLNEEHIQQSNSFKRLMYNVLGE